MAGGPARVSHLSDVEGCVTPSRWPPWSPSRAREELRAALGRAECELREVPPTSPLGAKQALKEIAGLRRALLDDRVVDEPRALVELLEALPYFDMGLVALLHVHGETSLALGRKAGAWALERARRRAR